MSRFHSVPRSIALAIALLPAAAVAAEVPLNPDRDVFFGEQHVHTSWSFDAFAFGDRRTGPEDFYDYATGKAVEHPGGFTQKLKRPLDWGAVTEHSEYMGIIQQAGDPESPLRKNSPWVAAAVDKGTQVDSMLTFKALSIAMAKGHRIDELASPAVLAPVWKRLVEIADHYYRPGRFTTFAAYEWTSTPDSKNLHRNIFFLDSRKVPEVPFTSIDSTDPRDLWQWMDRQRAAGNELLAVSHNGNISNGVMFPTEVDHKGRPIDEAYAQARLRNEPLTELKQVKGQSETTPNLSPNDEFAGYEVFVWHLLGSSGNAPQEYGSYVRQAYKDGIAMGAARGFNPYKFGVVSGSDSHVTVVPYVQQDFQGVHGLADDTIEERLDGNAELGLNSLWVTPAGLSAVWAGANTREELFAGMKRKETYSTSGVRMKVRMFGGWNFGTDVLTNADWIREAYDKGVPMGADLPPRAGDAKAPTFLLWATKDPDAANLDRIQVIKGWTRHGQSFEKVYDVSWSGKRTPDPDTGKLPAVGNTVNLATGSYTNTIGAVQLQAIWTDPDFDPALDAFYYARVLEIPTPRWSTIQAARMGRVPPSGAGFQPVVQERAWTSPIWYTPDEEARKSAGPGRTVAELERSGKPLDEAALRRLVVGRTLRITNTVTGRRYDVLYGATGRRLLTAVDGEPTDFTEAAELSHAGDASYEIRDGRLVTELAGTPFAVRVYRVGEDYVAARDNEFGYANYEVEPLAQ